MTEPPATGERTSRDAAPGRWRQATPRILEALAVNAVPLWGLFHGWSLGTLLVLYWCENLLNTFFIGARIWLHRKLTRKRGHWTTAEIVRTTRHGGGTETERKVVPTTLLATFAGTNLIFTLAHGVFVGAFAFLILKPGPSLADLRRGVLFLVAGMTVAFALDAARMRGLPFAWIRQRADAALGRMIVLHLSLIGGAFLLAATDEPTAFFAVFVGFKLLFDVATAFPQTQVVGPEPPRFLRWARRIGKPGEFDEVWRKEAEAQRLKMIQDEEVLDHVPA